MYKIGDTVKFIDNNSVLVGYFKKEQQRFAKIKEINKNVVRIKFKDEALTAMLVRVINNDGYLTNISNIILIQKTGTIGAQLHFKFSG